MITIPKIPKLTPIVSPEKKKHHNWASARRDQKTLELETKIKEA